jgi:biopolymer transport protein ExbD
MRRFSQRSSLVTLSEINITPLLDLAFVLLIIFVITTPLLEQSINLQLPKGMGQPDKKVDQRNVRTVEISVNGNYRLNKQSMRLDQLISRLVGESHANPDLIIYIRADEDGPYKNVAAVIDGCQRGGITRYSLRTEPTK